MTPVDEIKQKIDIVDFIGSYLELKKSGRNYKGLCPFHGEKTPSFMVAPELQIFKCFGCGEAGDLFNFHQKIEGIEFNQSLELLAERAGVKLENKSYDPQQNLKKAIFEINELTVNYYHFILTQHKVGKPALDYLKNRRELTDETIKAFNLGYSPDSWDSLYNFLKKKKFTDQEIFQAGVITKSKRGNYIDKFRGRIMFPLVGLNKKYLGFTARILGEGQPKYLNSPESPIFHKSSFLFGLDKAKVALKQDGVVFVEGSMDVLMANQSGIQNVLAPLGTSLTVGQLKLLHRYTSDVIFAFDSDLAGDTASRRAIELAEAEGLNVLVAMIPEEFQDLDELLRKDKKLAKQTLKEPIPAYDYYLVSALKRNNSRSPVGKKKITAELVPIFSKLTDPVTRDHYIKKIADELDISESVISELLSNPNTEEKKTTSVPLEKPSSAFKNHTSEEYVLALLLRAPLDTAQTVLYKLGQKDFTDEVLLEIFNYLKKYLLGRKRKFEIQHFIKRFDEDFKNIINNLYMWDLQGIGSREDLLENELERVFELLKKRTAKRELKELGAKIKRAEMENNKKELLELTKEFQELSEKLL